MYMFEYSINKNECAPPATHCFTQIQANEQQIKQNSLAG